MHSINTKLLALVQSSGLPRSLIAGVRRKNPPAPRKPPSNSYLRRRGSHSSDRVHSPSVSATFDGVLNRTRSLKPYKPPVLDTRTYVSQTNTRTLTSKSSII